VWRDVALGAVASDSGFSHRLKIRGAAATNCLHSAKEATMSIFVDRHQEVELSLDVEEQARIRLQHSPYRAIRRVSCHLEDGVLTLVGRVPTFHNKQLAQTAVAELRRVRESVTAIRVETSP